MLASGAQQSAAWCGKQLQAPVPGLGRRAREGKQGDQPRLAVAPRPRASRASARCAAQAAGSRSNRKTDSKADTRDNGVKGAATSSSIEEEDSEEGGLQVKTIGGVKYVTLDQARSMAVEAKSAQHDDYVGARAELSRTKQVLDGVVTERSRLMRELRKSMEDGVALEKRVKAAEAAAAEAAARVPTIGLEDAAALERRIKVAFDKEHAAELTVLKEQLRYAVEIATRSEGDAVDAVAAAEMQTARSIEAAVETLELETAAELQLARLAALNAREASAVSSLAARTALEEQQRALEAARAVREEAVGLAEKAGAAHCEARALEKEVEKLQGSLEQAQRQATEASAAAAAAERSAAKRVAAIERSAQDRCEEVAAAYEKLRHAAQQRAESAEQTSEVLERRVTELTGEVTSLRGEMSAALAAAAEATSRLEQLQAEQAERLEELQKRAAEEVQQERELVAAERLKIEAMVNDMAELRVDGVAKQLEETLETAQGSMREQLAALTRALTRVGKQRDYWRKRSTEMEEALSTLSAHVKVTETQSAGVAAAASGMAAANGNGMAAADPWPKKKALGGGSGRMRAAMSQSRHWEFWAEGPHSDFDMAGAPSSSSSAAAAAAEAAASHGSSDDVSDNGGAHANGAVPFGPHEEGS